MSACAITDHGTMSGVIHFYKACKEAGIKPILGMEAYITRDVDDLPNEKKTRDNRHLVLLAVDEDGFHNLIWLNNQAHLHNFYYNPRVFINHLADHNKGLIAMSACLAGVMAKKAVYKGEELEQPGGIWDSSNKAYTDPQEVNLEWGRQVANCFPERFYAEIQLHPNWQQEVYNHYAQMIAFENDWPLVLTTDAHYTQLEDLATHQLLMAQQFGKTIEEYKQNDEFNCLNYIREPDELYRAAVEKGLERAFWNTREIADKCNLEIKLGKYQTPTFDITRCADYEEFNRVIE